MTNASLSGPPEALGVGAIVGESFSILFGNIVAVIILGFIPTFVSTVISGFLIGWDAALGTGDPEFYGASDLFLFGISLVIQMGIYGVMIALLVQMAYDAKLGRQMAIGNYFGPAFSSIFPIVVLSIVVTILLALGLVAAIIPGLWVYAVFCVIVPAIVIERAGMGAMGRSAQLTKEFRWPIVGALILVWLCAFVLIFVAAFVLGLLLSVLGDGVLSIAVSIVLASAFNGFAYGLSAISVALIYARLREIKEGVGVDQLAAVFE